MLGTAVAATFAGFDGEVRTTTRKGSESLSPFKNLFFDALTDDIESVGEFLEEGDFIINCIGVIKPYIKDSNQEQRKNALLINSLFPHKISVFAETKKIKVIQIATDCVYSGLVGGYDENSAFDALDVYGKTKSLGEIPSASMMHLRVSIIGPEVGRSTSLLEWVINQEQAATISGFTDHNWNGVATHQFGKICRGIIEKDNFNAGVYHVVPGDVVSKFKLVSMIAEQFGRSDIKVVPKPSGTTIDRTLTSIKPEANQRLWKDAGYSTAPTIEAMIQEISIQR